VSFNLEKLMVRESMNGKILMKYMMVNGLKELDMDMEYGEELINKILNLKVTLILENGKKVKLMAMVFILGVMEIDMKVNGNCV
jgi:hypothetical protein